MRRAALIIDTSSADTSQSQSQVSLNLFDLDIWLVAQLTIQMAFDSKYSNQRLTVLSVKHEWDAITVPGQHGSAGLSDLPYEQNTV